MRFSRIVNSETPQKMRKPIVVVGSINLDLVATADHVPLPGETIIGKDFRTFHGGKGANQAVGVAKLGHPVSMLGNVGDDSFGATLKNALRRAGVAANCVRAVKGSSGVALINIGSDGQNNIVVVPGANGKLLPKDIAAHAILLRKAGMILVQLEIPLITLETAAAFAHRHKIPLMLDPAPARELPSGLLQVVAWITPNESETRILCGLPPTEPVTPETAARCADLLLARGPKNVVIKMGAQGAFLATADGLRGMIPSFAVKAVTLPPQATPSTPASPSACSPAKIRAKPPATPPPSPPSLSPATALNLPCPPPAR